MNEKTLSTELSDDELSEVTGGRQELQRFAQLATMAPGVNLSLLGTVASGVQTEITGEPKVGAQVMVKGTETGVVTDEIKEMR